MRLFAARLSHAGVFSPARPGDLSLTVTLEGVFEAKSGSGATAIEQGACLARDDADNVDLLVRGASMLVANVDAHLLEQTARKLGDGDLLPTAEIEPRISLASPAGTLLWHRLGAMWRDLSTCAPSQRSLQPMGKFEAELAEALVGVLGTRAADRGRDCGAVYLRRAEEFILAHLRGPISRADICAAAGVSARSLSRQFVRRHGVGPMTFLKQRRLEAAQRSLLAADPSEKSVTEVALGWGLHHLGRFSVEYRAAFGESPSQTLGR
jgi:AraC-like DNA-binding protein